MASLSPLWTQHQLRQGCQVTRCQVLAGIGLQAPHSTHHARLLQDLTPPVHASHLYQPRLIGMCALHGHVSGQGSGNQTQGIPAALQVTGGLAGWPGLAGLDWPCLTHAARLGERLLYEVLVLHATMLLSLASIVTMHPALRDPGLEYAFSMLDGEPTPLAQRHTVTHLPGSASNGLRCLQLHAYRDA
jgi:hypothetical protein